jgi:predicted nicotinamide N-methyase
MKTIAAKFLVCSLVLLIGCRRYREDLDYDHEVLQVWPEDKLASSDLYQFAGVNFEPDAIAPLRVLITHDSVAANQRILDLDAQTGILSLLSSQFEAKSVIAIADSPETFACVRYNSAVQQAELADVGCQIDVRQTTPMDVVKSEPQFTMILLAIDSNNRQRLPEFLDAIQIGLATGGRALIVGLSDQQVTELKPSLEARGLVQQLIAATIEFDKPDDSVTSSEPDVQSEEKPDLKLDAPLNNLDASATVTSPPKAKQGENSGDFGSRVLELKIDSSAKVKEEKAEEKKSLDK